MRTPFTPAVLCLAALLLGATSGSRAQSATRTSATPAAPSTNAPATVPPARLAGTFAASRIDREPLPLQDRVEDEDGTEYLIEFDRLFLSLRADQRFRASVRYRRTLFAADPRGRDRRTPLQSLTVTGTYTLAGDSIRFTPDPSDETRGLRMLAGSVRSARELVIPFRYRNGTQQRDRTLTLQRRDDIL